MRNLENSEDEDEIPYSAVFFSWSTLFTCIMAETIFGERNLISLGKCRCDNVQPQVHSISPLVHKGFNRISRSDCKFGKKSRGFYFHETSRLRSVVKIRPSQNGEITLSFTDVGKSCPSRELLT